MRSEKQNETARRGSKTAARPAKAKAKAGKAQPERGAKKRAGVEKPGPKGSKAAARAAVSAKAVRAPAPVDPTDDLLAMLLGPPPEALARRKVGGAHESSEAKRARVIEVAHELFVQNGPTRTTVSDVCRAAQIAPSVFYALFGSKEGLIDHVGEAKRREAEPLMAPILQADSTVREKIRGLLEAYLFRLAGKWRDSAKVQLEIIAESVHNPELRTTMVKRRDEMNAKMRALIEHGQRSGEIDASLDPCAVVDVLGALFIGMQVTRVLDAEFDHARYATAAKSLVMGAFWRCDAR